MSRRIVWKNIPDFPPAPRALCALGVLRGSSFQLLSPLLACALAAGCAAAPISDAYRGKVPIRLLEEAPESFRIDSSGEPVALAAEIGRAVVVVPMGRLSRIELTGPQAGDRYPAILRYLDGSELACTIGVGALDDRKGHFLEMFQARPGVKAGGLGGERHSLRK